jgi:hypothetical protein
MKVFFIILVVGFITHDLLAQQRPPGIMLKTGKIGERLPEEPAPDSERFKMSRIIPKDTCLFTMHLKEYVDGKKIDEFNPLLETVYSGRFSKGRKVSWEIVPDTSSDTLEIFVYFPGMIARPLKIPGTGKCFKYAPYRLVEEVGRRDEIPLMLFYEDDLASHETDNLVRRSLTDGKLNPDAAKNKALLLKIKRYVLLSYTLN